MECPQRDTVSLHSTDFRCVTNMPASISGALAIVSSELASQRVTGFNPGSPSNYKNSITLTSPKQQMLVDWRQFTSQSRSASYPHPDTSFIPNHQGLLVSTSRGSGVVHVYRQADRERRGNTSCYSKEGATTNC